MALQEYATCRHHRRRRIHRIAPRRGAARSRLRGGRHRQPADRRHRPTSRTCANRDFEFIQHDVTNYIYVEGPVDFVLHWASPASPIDYLELPIPTLKVGALGTHKALGLAKAKGATFVIASTSEVYGDPLEHPQKETYWGNVNPIGPRGVYDEAKRFAEAMTVAYHRYHGVDTKIVRIFNTYGPRMRVQRRPRRAGLHLAGAAQRGRDRVRRRHADAQLLLRQRPGGRHHPADARRDERSGEHRQPARR